MFFPWDFFILLFLLFEATTSMESPKNSVKGTENSSTGSLPGKQSKLVKIKNLTTVKLDQGNFIAWEAHIKTILRGYDLLSYVEPSFVPLEDLDIRQDQLLLGWIFASLSPEILSQIVSYDTSAKV